MPASSFDSILQQLLMADAKYGGQGFELYLLTADQASATKAHESAGLKCVGSFFHRATTSQRHPDCYVVFGNMNGENWEANGEAVEQFEEIAKLAGAFLPTEVRDQLSARQNDRASEWLAFMFRWMPPSKDLNRTVGELVWREPFRCAADAIRQGGLLSVPTSPAADSGADGNGYTVADIAAATEMSSDTVGLYAKKAGIPRPSVGDRSHRFSPDGTRGILQAMAQSSTRKTAKKARAAMQKFGL